MKKSLIYTWLLIVPFTLMGLNSCSEDDGPNGKNKEETVLSRVLKNNLIKFDKGIGEWETAIIYEEDGYILYKEEKIDETKTVDYYQIESPDGDYDCAILADQETSIPRMLIMSKERYDFIRKDGDKLYITRSTEEGCELIDSLQYSINNEGTASRGGFTFTTIEYINRDDKVKKVVKALDAILSAGNNYTSQQITDLKKALDKISIFWYYENVEEIIEELDLCRDEYGETGEDVIWCFTQYASQVKIHTLTTVRYGISVETGPEIKVTKNSAVVSGTVGCSSNTFYTLGRWGIIYSRNKNLSLDNYEGMVDAPKGNFEDVSFSGRDYFRVTLNNLEPNTTYYYATFYQFYSSDHGELIMPYGDKNAESYVAIRISPEEFTTKKDKTEEEATLYKLGWSGTTINGKAYYVLGNIYIPKYTKSGYYDEDNEEDNEITCHYYSFYFKDGICTDAKYNIEFKTSSLANEFASAMKSGEWAVDDEEDDEEDYNIVMPIAVYTSGKTVYIPLENFIDKEGESIKEGLSTTGIPQNFIYGKYDETKGEYICNNAFGIISKGNDIQWKANLSFTSDRKVNSIVLAIKLPNNGFAELVSDAFHTAANKLYQLVGAAPQISHAGNTITITATAADENNLVGEGDCLKLLKAIDKTLALPFISIFASIDDEE